MVLLYVEPPKGNAESAIDNWVQNHNEWESDAKKHKLREGNTNPDGSGTEYVVGEYRFYQDEIATTLLDNLESNLSYIQGGLWSRIGYHICDHDDETDSSGGCSWSSENSEVREVGTVPSDIPEIK
jgi:hypothetical protein